MRILIQEEFHLYNISDHDKKALKDCAIHFKPESKDMDNADQSEEEIKYIVSVQKIDLDSEKMEDVLEIFSEHSKFSITLKYLSYGRYEFQAVPFPK